MEEAWVTRSLIVIAFFLCLLLMNVFLDVTRLKQDIRSLRWFIWYTQEHQKWSDNQGVTMRQYDEYQPIHQDSEFSYAKGKYHTQHDIDQENEDENIDYY